MSGRDFLRRTNAASLLASTALQPGVSADFLTEGANNKFIQAAERLKLAGVAAGATANDTDANLKNRANHTGTMSSDFLTDGTTNKAFTATERGKLGALPDNATLQTSIGNRIAATEKGAVNGVATLDSAGKVPAVQLPSYVDDVLEFANVAAFPATGESGKIYVAQDTNKTYRWSGSAYPEISASPGSTDAVTEGSSNLYFTAQRVRDTLLAGVSVATNAVIAASDSFIVALGKLQAQISNRLQFDAAQTLSAGQKTQGQTNLGVSSYIQTLLDDADQATAKVTLGVDPTTLDDRYAKSVGTKNLSITATNFPQLLIKNTDGTRSSVVLENDTADQYVLSLLASGDLAFFRVLNGVFQDTPFTLAGDGTPAFGKRPTFGGVGLATLNEVGSGGTSGVASFNGRSGIVTPSNGDYTSAQISHTGGSLADALSALNTGKQTQLASTQAVELGASLSGDRDVLIDIHSAGAANVGDFEARIIRKGGVNGALDFLQTGTGAINFVGNGGFFYNGVALATLASPALTGTPTAPTAALGTNTTQIATMAALKAGLDTKEPAFDIIDEGVV